MLYFLLFVFFIFPFKNGEGNLFEQKEDCRISKIYLNSELRSEYQYDENNNLIKSELYLGRNYHFSTAEYDDLGRLITSNLFYTRAGNLNLKPDSSNFIQTRANAVFKYKEGENLINEVRYYRGNSIRSDEDVKDENLKYTEKAKYLYDSNDVLKEIILGKKKRKSARIIFTYDGRQNPILIE